MIPQELRDRPQWVLWRRQERDGKPTKVPYRVDGAGRASTTDPGTWAPYDAAAAASRTADGIGFVFTPGDPYVCVDLDGCVDGDGEIHPEAGRIVRELDGWSEPSPSGSGVHVVVRGEVNGRKKKTGRTPWAAHVEGKAAAFEIYDRSRFLTMCGNGTGEIRDAQPAIDAVHARLFPVENVSQRVKERVTAAAWFADDHEIIEKASAAKNGTKFLDLWAGRTADYDGDDSRADAALIGVLAFWTRDAGQLDRLFRRSGLMRDKWDERHGETTYGELTVRNVLALGGEMYTPPRAAEKDAEPRPQVAASVVTRASAIRSKRVRWLWKGYDPLGYLTIGTGQTKLGKSLFAAYKIARLTRGDLAGEFAGDPTNVLVVATEDGWEDMWKPRLVAADADLDRVGFVNIPDGWNVHDGLGVLEQGLREHPGPFVLLDAVMEHLPEAKGSETANSSTFIRSALARVRRLADEHPLAVYMSTHPPKGRMDNFTGAYHGSGAWVQVSRSCVLFGWHPDDGALPDDERRRVMLRAAGNIGRDPGAVSFRIGGRMVELDDGTSDEIGYVYDVEPCHVTARDLLAADRGSRGDDGERARPKVEVLAERIADYLADGQFHPSMRDELEAEGFTVGTIEDAKKRVGVYSRKERSLNGKWQWRLNSSNFSDSSTLRAAVSRARTWCLSNSDSSTDQASNPTNTEESMCRKSLTNGFTPRKTVHRSVEESEFGKQYARDPKRFSCSCVDGGQIEPDDGQCARCYGYRQSPIERKDANR